MHNPLPDYAFTNPDLLREALTHPSCGGKHYQRLEFLGDRVLGLVIGEWLVELFPAADEGELSRRLTFLVRESTLVHVADALDVAMHIQLGGGEVMKPRILADVMEALLGALWQDAGLDVVRRFVRQRWADLIDISEGKDAKTRLQELLQARKLATPVYEVIEQRGPDHDAWFVLKVVSALGEGRGEGRSKQVAGSAAATDLLEKIEKSV